MSRLFLTKLDGVFYTCKLCHTHLANIEELMSKAFHCRNGPAYLFNSIVNVAESAFDVAQQHKEGKFILERKVSCEAIEFGPANWHKTRL
ncbi:hypothetical protein KP509_36G005100 [Ceratopteris richardii]|uniref:Yippee domain-containing protein n=1 Tax=Ceratopteris richardii TaxID=49495 RepID=A0A8T2QAA7_CERRI|nr:hypothetical protein KP509_36G005100 [Ceratopteris richardii]